MRRSFLRAVVHVSAHDAVVPAAARRLENHGEGSNGLPVEQVLPCPDSSGLVGGVEFEFLF